MNSFSDLCISDIAIASGVRPAGRGVNHSAGRATNGILYIWDGEVRFFVRNKHQITAKTGELLFIPKGYGYTIQYTAPSTTFILVNLELFDKSGNTAIAQGVEVIARDDQSKRIASIMASLTKCGVAQSPGVLFRKKELLYKLLGIIYESNLPFTTISPKYPQIFAGVTMLEQTFSENLPVARFAQASNISVSLFRSLFHKQYNMSPIQYRNQLRIDRAVAILREGSCTVAEVAYACGFENIGYFCRCYKKITGQTPTQTKHDIGIQ